MTTPGKYRHLSQCSSPQGHFCILAIDHRANLRGSLDKNRPAPISDAAFTAFKQQVMQHLLPGATAVLTDPAHGIGAGIAGGMLRGQVGLIAPLEITNYDIHPSQREPALIPDWSAGKIKRVGGAGVKLLLYYHPDDPNLARKRAFVAQVVETCTHYDLPFFLEPIVYAPDPAAKLSDAEKTQVTVDAAQTFSAMGVDVLKLEFPVDSTDESTWGAALAAVDSACSVPWALLSAGVPYRVFERQAIAACAAGASGVMVGRAIWTEAVTLPDDERDTFLQTTARQRMASLATICATGADWRTRITPPPSDEGWYLNYKDLER